MADAAQRGRLVALYTLDGEWSRAAAQPNKLAAEIRLAWWSETLEAFAGGGRADHPAVEALGAVATGELLPLLTQAINAYADGRSADAADRVAEASVRLLDPGATLEQPSTAAFPAVAHRTLAPLHVRGRTLGELEKRLRITWAVLRGRV